MTVPTVLETLQRVCDQATDLDALTGNLAVLLDGLPDLHELADEREPEDIERIAQQARIVHRQVKYMRAELADALARLIADTTEAPSPPAAPSKGEQ